MFKIHVPKVPLLGKLTAMRSTTIQGVLRKRSHHVLQKIKPLIYRNTLDAQIQIRVHQILNRSVTTFRLTPLKEASRLET